MAVKSFTTLSAVCLETAKFNCFVMRIRSYVQASQKNGAYLRDQGKRRVLFAVDITEKILTAKTATAEHIKYMEIAFYGEKQETMIKNVLVTGAYGGMGRAMVKVLQEQGCRVFALDRRVEAPQENIIPIEVDITSEESVLIAVKEVQKHTDSLCAIIHFAGIYMLDSLVEISEESFRRIVDVNLYGAFLINKNFMPLLRKGSRILITTSELAPLDPLPFTGIYAVTKSALDKYAYSLRMELQLLGISVSVLRAGAVDTGMLDVSTDALDKFCKKTNLYTCNADRFKAIVDRVEARRISPVKIAQKSIRILKKRKPAFSYAINRNPLLLLLNILPKRLQLWAIRLVLRG